MTDDHGRDDTAAATLAQPLPATITTRKVVVWLVAIAVVLAVAVVYLLSGRATLSVVGAQTRADPRTHTFGQSYEVRNDGPVALHLTAATTHLRGIDVTGTNMPVHGLTLRPHGTVTINTRYRVTDCRNPPAGPLPVRLSIDRWWGTQSVTVQNHGLDYDDARTACGR